MPGDRRRGGALEDTAAERLLDELQVRKKIYDGNVEPYRDLELGRLDGVLLDLPIALYYARQNPRLKFTGQPLGKGFYAIAFRRDNTALADAFDAALQRLAEKGDCGRSTRNGGYGTRIRKPSPARRSARDVIRQAEGRWTFFDYFPLLLQGAGHRGDHLSQHGTRRDHRPAAGAMRLSGARPLRLFATGYVEFFRGIPVLLLLFFLYYGLPSLGARYGLESWLNLSAFLAAVIGFGLNYAAYESEIYRAGIGSIPVGQWEAAASLGMSKSLTFRRIILPQAIRVILPPMTNDFIALFKDTSLVSVIAVVELTSSIRSWPSPVCATWRSAWPQRLCT